MILQWSVVSWRIMRLDSHKRIWHSHWLSCDHLSCHPNQSQCRQWAKYWSVSKKRGQRKLYPWDSIWVTYPLANWALLVDEETELSLFTTKHMYGHVRVTYWRAPISCLNNVASTKFKPSLIFKGVEKDSAVETGLALEMSNHCNKIQI